MLKATKSANKKPVTNTVNIPVVNKPVTLTPSEINLLKACERGDLDAVYKSIWENANVNCKKPVFGSSPLTLASRQGHEQIVQVLLRMGANPSHADSYGTTAYHWAGLHGHDGIITQLLQRHGYNKIDQVNRQDQYGSTPLHFAALNNHASTVELLVNAGSEVNLANNDGHKPSALTSDEMIRGFLIHEEQRKPGGVHRKIAARMGLSQDSLNGGGNGNIGVGDKPGSSEKKTSTVKKRKSSAAAPTAPSSAKSNTTKKVASSSVKTTTTAKSQPKPTLKPKSKPTTPKAATSSIKVSTKVEPSVKSANLQFP